MHYLSPCDFLFSLGSACRGINAIKHQRIFETSKSPRQFIGTPTDPPHSHNRTEAEGPVSIFHIVDDQHTIWRRKKRRDSQEFPHPNPLSCPARSTPYCALRRRWIVEGVAQTLREYTLVPKQIFINRRFSLRPELCTRTVMCENERPSPVHGMHLRSPRFKKLIGGPQATALMKTTLYDTHIGDTARGT